MFLNGTQIEVSKKPTHVVARWVENFDLCTKAMEHYWDEIEQLALQQGVELTIEHKLYFTKINHRWVE